MYSNYLLTSIRTLKRNKLIVAINLLSVSLALSLCTLAYFNYEFNNSFNTFFPGSDDVYKINAQLALHADRTHTGASPTPLAKELIRNIPGIMAARMKRSHMNVRIDDKLFEENIAFIDPEFLDIFKFPTRANHSATVRNKQEIYLSQQAAERLFGQESAIGKTLTLLHSDGKQTSFLVGDVLQKFPDNTSFRFSMLLSMDNYYDLFEKKNQDWSDWVDGTFVRFSSDPEIVSTMADSFISHQNEMNRGREIINYKLEPILSWPNIEFSLSDSAFMGALHPASVIGIVSSALAILLMASFNFINTSIAISRKRLKEIAVRKIVGGTRSSLILQFMLESLVQIMVAMFISGFITYYLYGPYNALFSVEIVQFDFVHVGPFVSFLILSWLIVGILAGAYPALYMSKYKSLEIFRNKVKFSGRNRITKILLAFQFLICFYNLFALLIFTENAYFQNSLDRGYKVQQVINIPLNSARQFDALAPKIAQFPDVLEIAGTNDMIGFNSKAVDVLFNGVSYGAERLNVGYNYLNTLGVRLKAGQFFSENSIKTDNQILINQMMVDQLGDDLLHMTLIVDDLPCKVVGIVEDFHLRTLMLDNKIKPIIIQRSQKSAYTSISIRAKGEKPALLNAELEKLWYSLYPSQLYTGFYQNKVLDLLDQTNYIMITINVFIAIICIFICILGLYSLVSLTIQGRMKEFGIRKVLGASFENIMILINKDVLVLVILASVIGMFVSNHFISKLLDIIYAYHINISWHHFVISFIAVFCIAAIAITYKVVNTARSNPIEHLRNE